MVAVDSSVEATWVSRAVSRSKDAARSYCCCCGGLGAASTGIRAVTSAWTLSLHSIQRSQSSGCGQPVPAVDPCLVVLLTARTGRDCWPRSAGRSACLSYRLPVCLSVLLSACLSLCLSDCLPVCHYCLPDCPTVGICLSVCLSVCLPDLSYCLPVCLSVCLSVNQSVCLSLSIVCLSVCLSVPLSACLPICPIV